MGERSLAANDQAYDRLAGVYDALTGDYEHETWLARLHGIASQYGNGGRRLLDVGCGTGSSFIPLLGDGYDVSGCDGSSAMANIAAERVRDRARVWVADMRALPDLGRFDVMTCLDDVANHLVEPDDLVSAFASMARLMAPGAVLLFDANTLGLYQGASGVEERFERGGHRFRWSLETEAHMQPGGLAPARIEVHAADHEQLCVLHTARHHPVSVVGDCLSAAGLRAVAVLGQTTGAVLHREHSERDHHKTVFVAARA